MKIEMAGLSEERVRMMTDEADQAKHKGKVNDDEPVNSAQQEDNHENGLQPNQVGLTSNFETFWNICNTIQGLPILTIPYAVYNGGVLSIFTLLLVAAASNYTAKTIVKCLYQNTVSGKRIRVRDSYAEVGEAFCPKFGGCLVLLAQFIELLFVSAVYPHMVGRLLVKSFSQFPLPFWAWTIIGGLAFAPNILVKNLKQVAWTSIITVLAAKTIFVAVFTYSLAQHSRWEVASLGDVNLQTFPAALGIMVASYLSQPFVPVIEGSMLRKNEFNHLMNIAYFAMTLLNILIAILSNVTFSNVAEVITNNMPGGIFRNVVNIMAAVLSFTSYTLPMFTIFEIAEKSSFPCLSVHNEKAYSPYTIAFRLLMISLSVFLAAFVPDYSYLLAFVGSIAGICLEFIFPPLFHFKIYFDHLSAWERILDVTVVVVGTAVSALGVVFSGRSLIEVYRSRTTRP